MSLPSGASAVRRVPWSALAGLAAALGASVAFLAMHFDFRDAVDHGISLVRALGPWAFFAAMALVPAPLSWFTIPAGEAFAAELTLPGVIVAALAAVAVQIALCYWAARFALRPVLQRWVAARGWVVPQVTKTNALAVVLLVRLVPGPPLSLQCCLLGLAEVPFALYFAASWALTVPWVIGGVVLGRGVLHGNFALAGVGAGVFGAAAVAVHLARRRFSPHRPE